MRNQPPTPEPPQQPENQPAAAPQPPEPPRAKPPVLPYVLLAVFLLTLLPGPLFFASLVLPGPLKTEKTLIIPRGMSVKGIAQLLDQNDILINPILFRGVAHLVAEDKLQAGEYRFLPGQNAIDIATMMRDGKTVLRQVTVPEGLTSREIVELLRTVPALTGEITSVPSEGSLLPESYRYAYGDSRENLIARMQKEQKEMMASLWEKRDAGLPLASPEEALILASIVEKETGRKPEERPIVAGVFYNRLKKGMPLQTDPTVIYALTKGEKALGRDLLRKDLATPSPYNTYLAAGLPPGPICNPGRAAIEAVLHPAQHDYLYFVADGTGGHAFAASLQEHNRNVAKWQSLSRP